MTQALAELGWRTFNFFNLIPAQDPADPTKKATILQGIDILCWSPGDAFVLFGEPKGAIFQLDRGLDIRFFKAFKQRLIHFTHCRQLLVTLGEDTGGPDAPGSSSGSPSSSTSSQQVPVLKLWDLAQWEEAVAPKCKQQFPLSLGRKVDVAKASAVAVNEALSLIVVGLSNTSLYYACADLQRERSTPKFRPLRDGASTLGAGQLVGIAVGTVGERTIISCVSEKSLSSYILGPDGNLQQTVLHDAKGCERNCWYFSPRNNQLVVAGREMVHFYSLADCLEMGGENGRCHALGRNMDKVQLIELDGMVALLTEQDAHIQSTSSPSSKMTMLNVYDIQERYIAFFCSMPSPCHLFLLDGQIYLLNAEGALNRLVEEGLDAKLDILLRKNLFDLAISIVRRSRHSPGEGEEEDKCHGIHMKYGDYLYGKGDFDNAVQQYVETIGHVEPSSIIKRFLDGPRIGQLCHYLEQLHLRGDRQPTIGQHTTLLLSAYVKLGAVAKLGEFIDQGERHLARAGFDPGAAIRLLRSAQFPRVAAKLALKCHRPEQFLDILCQDTKEWAAALRFIEKLPPPQACAFLELYGPILLENLEEETLAVIRQMITGREANMKQLVKMLMGRPKRMEELFSELNMAGQLQDPQLRTILLEQRLRALPQKALSSEQLDELLQLVGPDNFEQALLLAHQYKCPPLAIHILRSQNRKEDLLRYLLKEGSVVEALELCGEQALRDMWIDLIGYVSARKSDTKREDLLELLKRVAQSNCLPPLVVLELLSRDESLQVGDVRDYVVGWLERQNAAIQGNEAKLVEQERRLAEMNAEIEDLENNVQVFQVSKCAVCNNPLQVPAIHFLCRHSYHANCFESYSGSSDQCPACLMEARKKQEQNKDVEREEEKRPGKQQQPISYQQFRAELTNSNDAMALISEYIASGAFSSSAIIGGGQMAQNSGQQTSGGRGGGGQPKEKTTTTTNPFEEDE